MGEETATETPKAPHRPDGPKDRTPLWYLAAAVILSLASAAAIVSWRWRMEPGTTFTGLPQADMLCYSSIARELFENGNGFFYANPFDSDPASPRVYFHLIFIILGWAQRLSGLPFWVVWHLLGVPFGIAMYWLAYRMLTRIVAERAPRAACAVIFLVGGGITWAAAVGAAPFMGTLGFARRFFWLEVHHSWWFTNLQRNLIYTTEAFYHCLFFGAIIAYLDRRFALTAVLLFLVWWSHPWTGPVLTGVLFADAALRLCLGKDVPPVAYLVAIVAVFGGFAAYNLLWLPRFPAAAYIAEMWRSLIYVPRWWTFPLAYGPLLAAAVFLFSRKVRSSWMNDPAKRLAVVWALVVFCLMNHHWVVRPPFEPMHFSHGYLYVPLAMLTVDAASRLLASKTKRTALAVWAALVGVLVPDNIIFYAAYLSTPPKDPLVYDSRRAEVFDFLNTYPERLTVAADPACLAYQLATYTRHRPLVGHWSITPFQGRKTRAMQSFLMRNDASALIRMGVRLVVLARAQAGNAAVLAARGKIKLVFSNDEYSVFDLEPR